MWPFKSKRVEPDWLKITKFMEEARKKEGALVAEALKSKHGKELEDAYLRGYAYGQSELFASMRRDPEAYHKFIDAHAGVPCLHLTPETFIKETLDNAMAAFYKDIREELEKK